eukprot:3208728-Rhodomonas_salina.3
MSGTEVAHGATPRRESRRTFPMRCPVLTSHTILRASYAMSGTEIAYDPTPRREGRSSYRAPRRRSAPLSSYARPTPCTDVEKAECPVLTSQNILRASYAMSVTDVAYGATRFLRDVRYRQRA